MNNEETGKKALNEVREYFQEGERIREAQEKEQKFLDRKNFWRALPGNIVLVLSIIWIILAWGFFWKEMSDNNLILVLFAFVMPFFMYFGVGQWYQKIQDLKQENQRLKKYRNSREGN